MTLLNLGTLAPVRGHGRHPAGGKMCADVCPPGSGSARLLPPFPSMPDLFRLALGLLVVIDIGRLHQQIPGLEGSRPGLLLVALLLTLAFLHPPLITFENLRNSRIPKLILLLALLGAGSVLFGISPGASARFLLDDYSRTLALCALLLVGIRDERDLALIAGCYVVGCVVWIVSSTLRFDLTPVPGGGLSRLGDLPTFDPNDVALVLVVGLPLALWITPWFRAPWLFLLPFLAGLGIALARTGSRGGLLALGVVIVAFVGIGSSIRAAFRWGALAAVALALLLAAPSGYWRQMGTILTPTEDYNWSDPDGRLAIARRGLSYMVERPFLGVGIGNFARAEGTLGTRADPLRSGTRLRWLAPHNSYLQVGAEMGWLALGVWGMLLLKAGLDPRAIGRRLSPDWREGSASERFLARGADALPLAILAFAVSSAFLSFAYLPVPYILFALAAAWESILARRDRASGSRW